MSAVYMAIIPLFILIVYFFVDPLNTRLLFVTPLGQIVLTVAAILNLVSYFWAVRILNADI